MFPYSILNLRSTAYSTDPVGNTFTLNTDQRETTVGKDNYTELLYAPQWDCPYSANIPINLYHQLARLTIELTHEAAGDLSVSEVTIGSSSIPTTAVFRAPTSGNNGTWDTFGGSTGTIKARTDVTNEKYSAVLFPNSYAGDNHLINVKTSNNRTYAYIIPTAQSITLSPGSQYCYTITVKDKFYKTTAAIATRDNLTVGDIICSDGCIYAASNASYIAGDGKTPIGVIAYVGTSANDPICENRRALVMSLKECEGTYTWGGYGTNEPDDLFPNNPYFQEYPTAGPEIAIAQSDYRGLEKTNYLCQSGHGHAHPAASAAKNYSVNCSGITNCTGWFLPSVGQWCAVLVYMGGQTYAEQRWRSTYDTDLTAYTNICNYLANAGSGAYDTITRGDGILYYTSSEGDATHPVYIFVNTTSSPNGSHISHGTNKNYSAGIVRPFFAF